MENTQKGITIIALIITIIVLVILSGITISVITGDNSIIFNSQKAKFRTEIKGIEEQIELAEVEKNNGEDFGYGTLELLIGKKDRYNEILLIENGELVYDSEKTTDEETKWLEEMGIYAKKNIIPIYTKEQLAKIATGEEVMIQETGGIKYTFNIDAHYGLQYDIDFQGNESNLWNPIQSFQGCLDGNYHQIKNVYIETTEISGLIKRNEGTIKNLGISGNIKGSYVTGAIAGENRGIIENCYNLATVEADNPEVGGIVGSNDGTVKESYNSGKVIGLNRIGGIVGTNYGEIINCYNTANLDHLKCMHKGGIVGHSNSGSKIYNCYNIGLIGNTTYNNGSIVGTDAGVDMSNCYGLNNEKIEIAGYTESTFESCTMKSKEEMQTKEFLKLLDINIEKKWKAGELYPKLYWE